MPHSPNFFIEFIASQNVRKIFNEKADFQSKNQKDMSGVGTPAEYALLVSFKLK